MLPQEIPVPPRGEVPGLVLHKGIVTAEVVRHGAAAPRTAGNQLRGDSHVPLLGHHAPHRRFVVVGPLVAGLRALPQPVVPLGAEQAELVEPGLLKTVVHVNGNDETVLAAHQSPQPAVGRADVLGIAVEVDVIIVKIYRRLL